MPNMTPEELRERIKDIKRKAVSRFHNNHDDGDLAIYDAVNEMEQLFTDLCGEVIGPMDEVMLPAGDIQPNAFYNTLRRKQLAALTKLTGKEI